MHNGILFLILLSAHLVGDFYLQTPTLANKNEKEYSGILKNSWTFAEYYLIGTLYSVLFALIAYLFVFKVVLPVTPVIPPTPILLITPTPLP